MNENSNLDLSRSARRSRSLLAGLLFGAVGVLVDVDHIVCVVAGYAPWNPEAHEYGCRLWHNDYRVIAWYLIGAVIALVAGWIIGVAYHATRPAADL